MLLQLDILTLVVTTAIGFVTTGTLTYLVHFVGEQRRVNAANALANRSMQRDVLYRYFAKVVERGSTSRPRSSSTLRTATRRTTATAETALGP